MRQATAAEHAKHLLRTASRRLLTADPLPDVSDILDESLTFSLDDDRARQHRTFETNFAETAPNSLSFLMAADGPGVRPADRVDTTTRAVRGVVGRNFGPQALHWLESRLEPVTDGHASARPLEWGAWFGSGFDPYGLAEAYATYEWGPTLMEALPSQLFRLARVATEAVPGLRPAFSSVRCGRSSGTQQVSFELDAALPLANLKGLMDRIGLGHQHAGFMSACAFVLGARFTLPPNTALLTLRPVRSGVEMRLDVDLAALPDTPSQLLSLLRLQMAERPRSVRALDHWLMALTPDGYDRPGSMSVLSVITRPDLPARIALHLRPAMLDSTVEPSTDREPPPPPAIMAAPPAPATASASVWGP